MSWKIALLLLLLFSSSVTSSVLEPKTLKFIGNYFRTRSIRTITYISCDASENDVKFLKYFWGSTSITVRVVKSNLQDPKLLNQNIANGVVTTSDCLLSFKDELNKDTQRQLFRINMHWLIFGLSSGDDLEFLHFSLSSDVKIVKMDAGVHVTELYKIKPKENFTKVPLPEATRDRQVSRRRRNFNGTYVRCAMTVAFPEVFTGLDDIKNRHIDTYARGNWPIVKNLQQALNFSLDMFQVDSYGWNVYGNGSFTGLIGLLQRREIEFGASAALMRPDRIPLVDRTAETLNIKALIFFRQPHLSTISNIFILPFNSQVWCCIFVFYLLSVAATYVQVVLNRETSLLESVTTVTGAICQQGHDETPNSISGRVVFWTTFIASVFIFTSYSACIVALLQSPSNSIKTVDDLVKSPLKVGFQNQMYSKVYLKETTSSSIQQLYKTKILPFGNRSFTDPETGMRRVQHDLYAFQVETQAAYKYIKEHFFEYEKCQLGDIELLKLPATTIPVQKDSQFREIFTINLRWQREIGLINHAVTIWIGEKERCRDHAMHFNSVGITESKPAFIVLLIGMGIAFSCFIIEQWKVIVPRLKRLRPHLRISRWKWH